MILPTKSGQLEIEEATGQCRMKGCKIKGGGLVRIQETTDDADKLIDLALEGIPIVLCGQHFRDALALGVVPGE